MKTGSDPGSGRIFPEAPFFGNLGEKPMTEDLIRNIVIVGAVTLVLSLLSWQGRKLAAVEGDWTVLSRGRGVWIYVGIMTAAAVLSFGLGILIYWQDGGSASPLIIGTLLAAVPVAYGAYLLLTDFRYSARHIRHRLLWWNTEIPWSDVSAIRWHPLHGPRLHYGHGKRLVMMSFWSGYRDFIEHARKRGIAVDARSREGR